MSKELESLHDTCEALNAALLDQVADVGSLAYVASTRESASLVISEFAIYSDEADGGNYDRVPCGLRLLEASLALTVAALKLIKLPGSEALQSYGQAVMQQREELEDADAPQPPDPLYRLRDKVLQLGKAGHMFDGL